MTGKEIRARFLNYFRERGHTIVPSSSLIPHNDPTLLFANAGMNQFKDCFLGLEKRDYVRACSSQKCVRAGGKHNDLENVGRTARHHTFFEMLGNFSFGDYFKKEAIAFAWEFLTVELGLDKSRLYVTVYKDDEEAADIWHRQEGVPRERIYRFGEKDNFWAMGDTGPCGPCSEIIYDQGPAMGCGKATCAVGCDCDRYLELWNLVFMQFERSAAGALAPLPHPSIDTGAGLERLAAVLQGVTSNFDTDLLRPIIAFVEELCDQSYGSDPARDVSMRVIADHARSTTFLVADGVLPSNEGRGYVLRRILRRGLRHGRLLGLDDPFMAKVTRRVVELMQGAYPDLADAQEHVARVTLAEEERFGHTLRVGLRLVESLVEDEKAKGRTTIPGGEIFRLYDTYGFPVDLLRDIATDHGLVLDESGFEQAMAEQRTRARESWVGSGEAEVPVSLKDLTGSVKVEGLWYTTLAADAHVSALLVGEDRQPVETLADGATGEVVLDRTPFYPEAGGQVGDSGTLFAEGILAEVEDTQRPVPGLVLHRVRVKRGTLRKGQTVRTSVDVSRRRMTAKNHTATHLLHAALRQTLGDHVKQAGSLVAPERLRFDFTHFSPLTPQEVDRIEEAVNAQVWENRGVVTQVMGLDEALASGATALFGEKYGEQVRVVSVPEFSTELCGGTHVAATGEIGLFKIVSQGGVAAGVRRIEAVTGPGAYQHVKREAHVLAETAARLKARPMELADKVDKLTETSRDLEREVQRLQARLLSGTLEHLLQGTVDVNGVRVVGALIEAADSKGMRELGDRLRDRLQSGVVALAMQTDGKVTWVTMVTKDLTGRIHAGNLARELAKLTGGGGGGRPDIAEAGGKDPAKIPEALGKLPELVSGQLKG